MTGISYLRAILITDWGIMLTNLSPNKWKKPFTILQMMRWKVNDALICKLNNKKILHFLKVLSFFFIKIFNINVFVFKKRYDNIKGDKIK